MVESFPEENWIILYVFVSLWVSFVTAFASIRYCSVITQGREWRQSALMMAENANGNASCCDKLNVQ